MGHSINGFIAKEKELTELVAGYKAASVIPLPQDFAFVPLTEALYDELTANREFLADICDERFLYLTSKLFQIGRGFSVKTPIAYLETDYFGGEGFQKAVAWNDGDVCYYPAVAGNEEGFQIDARESQPVNSALQSIGVSGYLMADEHQTVKDEFEELGLDNYRSNEDWIASI